MDPRSQFSFTGLLNNDDDQQNPQQQPSFPIFSQTQNYSQFSQAQPYPQFQQGPSLPQFGQFPVMPQFQQPGFDPQQFQQFLQWQELQKTSQIQQPQFQQTQEDLVESPSKAKAAKKKKKPSKMVCKKNDEQPTKTSRQKWPQSDEVLLAQGMISTSEDPIVGNNQIGDAYWGKIGKYYNESEPVIPRDAHNLRSHWHMFKSKVNRFNELYLQVKSRYRSGWSDDQYIQEARQLYINDPSNKTSAAFTYEHVWNVVNEHGKYNSATHVHGFQPPKRTKTNSSGGYTSSASASDANFGQTPEITTSLEDVDNEDFEVQVQQVTPTRPIGRDKAKAKLKGKAGIESSEYDIRKLKLIDDISSTNRAKSEAISKFEHRIDKFYEIEQKKLEMKQKKMLFLDTTFMNPDQRAEHEAMCAEIREKYGYNRF